MVPVFYVRCPSQACLCKGRVHKKQWLREQSHYFDLDYGAPEDQGNAFRAAH